MNVWYAPRLALDVTEVFEDCCVAGLGEIALACGQQDVGELVFRAGRLVLLMN